ncbi:MAG: flagellar hook-length control protein FliK [Kiritimatiellae bacterium]|nr:flagellar hook-length control protein FliK [Kiritimatiellia bacterium]
MIMDMAIGAPGAGLQAEGGSAAGAPAGCEPESGAGFAEVVDRHLARPAAAPERGDGARPPERGSAPRPKGPAPRETDSAPAKDGGETEPAMPAADGEQGPAIADQGEPDAQPEEPAEASSAHDGPVEEPPAPECRPDEPAPATADGADAFSAPAPAGETGAGQPQPAEAVDSAQSLPAGPTTANSEGKEAESGQARVENDSRPAERAKPGSTPPGNETDTAKERGGQEVHQAERARTDSPEPGAARESAVQEGEPARDAPGSRRPPAEETGTPVHVEPAALPKPESPARHAQGAQGTAAASQPRVEPETQGEDPVPAPAPKNAEQDPVTVQRSAEGDFEREREERDDPLRNLARTAHEHAVSEPAHALGAQETAAARLPVQPAQAAEFLERTEQIQTLLEQFDRHVLTLISGKAKSMTVRLSPPSLGSVTLNCRDAGGAVQLEIFVENSAVRRLIDQQESALRQILEEAGFKLSQFDVRTQNNQTQARQDLYEQAGRGRRGEAEDLVVSEAVETVVPDQSHMGWPRRNGVWLIA